MSVKNAAVCRLVCTEREPERERARDGGTESQGEKGVRYLRLGLRFPLGCRTVTDDRQAGYVVVLVRCAFPTFKLASIALEIRAITSTQLNETG